MDGTPQRADVSLSTRNPRNRIQPDRVRLCKPFSVSPCSGSQFSPCSNPSNASPPGGAFSVGLRDDLGVTRRRGLIASGIATVVLLVAMSPAQEQMQDTGGPGILPFELAGGQDRADEILAEWGEDGRSAARESLWIDFGFLLAYGAFLTLALAASRDRARQRGWRRLAAVGGIAVSLGALAAAFDALENVCLLLTIDDTGTALPVLATVFAACKFVLLTVAIAYLLAGLAMRLRNRGPATRALGR
jgi:hypothetical protein